MSKEYLLVDGYNIIFSWKDFNPEENLDGAKNRLIDMLCNYQGMKRINLILVFDAYRVEGFAGSVEKRGGIYIVYTKEAETADSYIEKTSHRLPKGSKITVATSDALEQVIIMGAGAYRMSANDLRQEVMGIKKEIKAFIDNKPAKNNMLVDNLDREAADYLEALRRRKY